MKGKQNAYSLQQNKKFVLDKGYSLKREGRKKKEEEGRRRKEEGKGREGRGAFPSRRKSGAQDAQKYQ